MKVTITGTVTAVRIEGLGAVLTLDVEGSPAELPVGVVEARSYAAVLGGRVAVWADIEVASLVVESVGRRDIA